MRDLSELRDSGVLWLINRAALHPHGVALALQVDDSGTVDGWDLVPSDPGEPWSFDAATDVDGYRKAQQTLKAARAD